MTNTTTPRSPQAFDPDDPALKVSPESTAQTSRRDEHAQSAASGADEPAHDNAQQPVAAAPLSQGIRWGALLVSAMFALLLLATGVWLARFTSVALARDDWVGWAAQALIAVAGLAAVVLLLKELFGLFRLRRLSRIRRDADNAIASNDRGDEERAVRALKRLARGRSSDKWNLAAFREEERHMDQPGQLLGLADRVLLERPDRQARRIVFESARRVGVVAAVVPITFLVMLFVFVENVRMVRRLADAYGGRPGAIGGARLLWRVIMHVAATGAIALTDDLFGQFLGQDIIRRLSRRLGEGAFIGALTARLGVAAIEVCRPLPYIEAAPLRSRHIVRELFPEIKPGEMVRSAFQRRSDKESTSGQ